MTTQLTSTQLTPTQQTLIETIGLNTLDLETFLAITHHTLAVHQLSTDQLVECLACCNYLYRQGHPVVTDDEYDFVFLKALKERDPDHPYLHQVEPEFIPSSKTFALPEKMLSTDKAYSKEAVEKWIQRLEKAASEIALDMGAIVVKVTAKLDGFAAYDSGERLYTRGDGVKGADISRVFDRGLTLYQQAQRGLGAGEIVVKKSYFDQHLTDHFENARNFQAAILAEKKIDPHVEEALKQGAACFCPFSQLPHWQGLSQELLADFTTITQDISKDIDFDVDGVIIEAVDDDLKMHLGATRHHHRWQIALKENKETAIVKVLSVTPQTSRTGRVNPVVELEPTKLSGATISRASAHHFGLVKSEHIGPGAVIELVRSGLVIPKIERVISKSMAQIPSACPSCGHHLLWDKDYLYCPDTTGCPEQIEHTIEHFFKSLGNNDGFGKKTIEKLHQEGIDSIYAVYQLDQDQLIDMGFGEKTAQNLVLQLRRSRLEAIEDWRFLMAFGVVRMGGGNSERLLQHHRLEDIFKLSVNELVAIDGFAKISAQAMVEGLASIKDEFFRVFELGFNIQYTPLSTDSPASSSPIAGKLLVFTGTMTRGTRTEMQAKAKLLGAKIGKSVTGKTDYLITGEKVGQNKINDASKKGVHLLTEQQYLDLIG